MPRSEPMTEEVSRVVYAAEAAFAIVEVFIGRKFEEFFENEKFWEFFEMKYAVSDDWDDSRKLVWVKETESIDFNSENPIFRIISFLGFWKFVKEISFASVSVAFLAFSIPLWMYPSSRLSLLLSKGFLLSIRLIFRHLKSKGHPSSEETFLSSKSRFFVKHSQFWHPLASSIPHLHFPHESPCQKSPHFLSQMHVPFVLIEFVGHSHFLVTGFSLKGFLHVKHS